MSEDIKFSVDYYEFNKALSEYMQVTNKSFVDAINRCAKNVAIQSLKGCKKADTSSLTQLKEADKFMFWLSWQIREKVYGKRTEHNTKYALRTGVMLESKMQKQEGYKRAVKAINRRKSSVGFLRAFFAEMGRAVDGQGQGKKFGGIVPTFSRATEGKQSAEIGAKYDYKKSGDATKAEQILWDALQVGVNKATQDMVDYMRKKVDEAAKSISAK